MSRSSKPRPGTVVNYDVAGEGTPDSPAVVWFSFCSDNAPGIAAIRAALPEGTRLEVQSHRAEGDYKLFATNPGTPRKDMVLLWLELADKMNWRFGHVR